MALINKLSELESQARDLVAQRAQLSAPAEQAVPTLEEREIYRRIQHVTAILDSADIESKRAILRALIQKVTVNRIDKKIFGEITYYYPPPGATDPKVFSSRGSELGVCKSVTSPGASCFSPYWALRLISGVAIWRYTYDECHVSVRSRS